MRIRVGEPQKMFKVSEKALDRYTTFFGRHGNLGETGSTDEKQVRPAALGGTAGPGNTVPMGTNREREYVLRGPLYQTDAFLMLVNAINAVPPGKPRDSLAVYTLLRTYLLSCEYDDLDLQNAVLSRIREYHGRKGTQFELKHLNFLVKSVKHVSGGHEGDDTRYGLVRYLVEQCAWEVLRSGQPEFERHNESLDKFTQRYDFVGKAIIMAIIRLGSRFYKRLSEGRFSMTNSTENPAKRTFVWDAEAEETPNKRAKGEELAPRESVTLE